MALPPSLPSPASARQRLGWGWRRALPWVALLALLVVAQSLLLALTVSHEAGKAQDQAEQVAAEVAGQIRKQVTQSLGLLQFAADRPAAAPAWQDSPALVRMEWRGVQRQLMQAVNNPRQIPPLPHSGPEGLVPETELACASALRQGSAQISRSYFVPLAPGLGLEVADLCAARLRGGEPDGFVIATLALRTLLEAALLDEHARGYEVSLVEADNTRLARAGLKHGRGVYVFQRLVDLPGQSFQLRVDSVAGAPSWVPNLPIALVMGLTLALFVMVVFSDESSCWDGTGMGRRAARFLTLPANAFFRNPGMADFAQQVEALRPQLLRYARSQLRNDAWAEDAVSDTLLAALEKLLVSSLCTEVLIWSASGDEAINCENDAA